MCKTTLQVVQTSRMPAPPPSRPFSEFQPRGVRGVLTDIDDTLTTAGTITPDALRALGRLKAAGLPVIAITGRPMGWSEPFARAWPIDAIVAENGAVALFRDAGDVGDVGDVYVEYAQDTSTRQVNGQRLAHVAARLQREVPGAVPARDSAGRVTDIAIDHAEFAQLSPDKLSGARWIVQRLFGRALDAERAHWVYVGDSTNDQPLFGHVEHSVGVANLLDFAAALTVWPRYITQQPRGAGFAEVADVLLRVRAAEARGA
jgi:hydroxymethylpyrimidine pyrophosphatase-like HAD family hydrolase